MVKPIWTHAILLWMALTVAACVERGVVRVVPAARTIGQIEQIYIGTTRREDLQTGDVFGTRRQPDLRFARIDVSIPPQRVAGEITWPAKGRATDPTKQFVAVDQKIYASAALFRSELHHALAARPAHQRDAVIFIHGFNNNFAEGTYRLAQLGHDLKVGAVLVHYSWPSRASPLGYVYDRDSALFARDGLEELIDQVTRAGAQHVTIVAHSMGASVAMEALRQMRIGGKTAALSRINGVLLMSPDMDVDVFHEAARRIGHLPQPFIIFTSKKDRALALSARLTGQRDRVGNLVNPKELGDLKITLVDTTAFSTGAGHFNVGNSPALLAILGNITNVDAAFAADRTGRVGLFGGVVLTVENATQIIMTPVRVIAQQ
ncbi:MAG: alpha/beta fold hydrolase [Rhodobacteraceae bacterium]|nr:alpha/beta fold hydrolase [Paracoccaceae bacterium]